MNQKILAATSSRIGITSGHLATSNLSAIKSKLEPYVENWKLHVHFRYHDNKSKPHLLTPVHMITYFYMLRKIGSLFFSCWIWNIALSSGRGSLSIRHWVVTSASWISVCLAHIQLTIKNNVGNNLYYRNIQEHMKTTILYKDNEISRRFRVKFKMSSNL